MGKYSLLQQVALGVHQTVGQFVPETLRHAVREKLFPTPEQREWVEIFIDVVGVCNLRCPSCPVGNTGFVNPRSLIDVERFRSIVNKACAEYGVGKIGLYNWAEPLLHPRLPELVRIVKEHNVWCALSSNLNIIRNIDEILLARPDEFRVSLSGFTQDVYSQTHRGGNIERVKTHMTELARAIERTGSTNTRVEVHYHKYQHNLHEVEEMHRFATSLGFNWLEAWAYYMPIERVVEVAEGRLPAEQQEFVETQFALPIEQAIQASKKYRNTPCSLLARQLVLDLEGNLLPCCGVYNYSKNQLGSFLEMTPADVRAAKDRAKACNSCMKHGAHMYATYYEHPEMAAEFNALAEENLRATAEGRTAAAGKFRPIELPVL